LDRIASIDIGSNTLRLLIAEKTETGLKPVYRDREIVRLGRNFYPERRMSSLSFELALSVLKRFKRAIESYGACPIRAVGTGVLREATNTQFFLKAAQERIDLPIRIISGLEEARIMARGTLSVFTSPPDRTTIFDIGGGSTEVAFLKNRKLRDRQSLPLGVVGLTEVFLPSDPSSEKEMAALRNHCRNILEKNLPGDATIDVLIGTAGTATTLAAMAKKLTSYDPDLINGTVLTRDQLAGLFNEMVTLPISQRAQLPGLEPGRADIIFPGLVLVQELLTFFRQEKFLVSDAGLLEGLMLDEGSRGQGAEGSSEI
jgi:exopolyphosphatase / guanosine-5'-triphosphate,3'-diphosphate pyrophosphatase